MEKIMFVYVHVDGVSFGSVGMKSTRLVPFDVAVAVLWNMLDLDESISAIVMDCR